MKKSYKKHFGIKNRRFLWAKGLAICFFTIFAMSHNVSALTLTNNVTENYTVNSPYHRYITNDLTLGSWVNSSVTRSYTGSGTDNIIGVYLRSSSNTSVTLEAGQYVEIQGWIRVNLVSESGDGFMNIGGFYGLSQNTDVNCDIKNIAQVDQDFVSSSKFYIRRNLSIVCLMKEDATSVYTNLYLNSNGYSLANLVYNFNSFTVYDPNVSDAEKEEEATEDAVDNSETASDDAQSSSESATSSLLSVFAGFANVITNASATNCVIDAPLNTTFSDDNFTVDLCGLDLPSGIGTLTSIIAVMAVVPFAISMFNKFISIMESFQR